MATVLPLEVFISPIAALPAAVTASFPWEQSNRSSNNKGLYYE